MSTIDESITDILKEKAAIIEQMERETGHRIRMTHDEIPPADPALDRVIDALNKRPNLAYRVLGRLQKQRFAGPWQQSSTKNGRALWYRQWEHGKTNPSRPATICTGAAGDFPYEWVARTGESKHDGVCRTLEHAMTLVDQVLRDHRWVLLEDEP